MYFQPIPLTEQFTHQKVLCSLVLWFVRMLQIMCLEKLALELSWSISTFSAAKEMEEQTESASVLFTRCYLQVDADIYSKHVCVQYICQECS